MNTQSSARGIVKPQLDDVSIQKMGSVNSSSMKFSTQSRTINNDKTNSILSRGSVDSQIPASIKLKINKNK